MYVTFLVAVTNRWRRTLLFLGVCYWVFVFVIVLRSLTSKQCYNVQVLGDSTDIPCQSDKDCSSLKGSKCFQSTQKCACPGGQVPSSDMSQCLPVAENYGAACVDNAQCTARLLAGAVCEGDKGCVCTEGFHYLHGVCWRSVGLNGSCSESEQCFENYNYESLSCREGRCDCSVGFYLRGLTHCRREGKAPGDECTFDMDCRFDDNAKCTANKCVLPGSVDRRCPSDGDETPHIVTLERRDALECDDNTDCSELGPNAECNSGGNCWCRHGYYMNTTSSTCVAELGEKCSQIEDCSHIKYATCPQQKIGEDVHCSCTVRYTPSPDNRKCTILRSFGSACQTPNACLNFGPLATCDAETLLCGCQQTSHFEKDEQMCWTSRGINQTCSSEKDCATESGVDGITCTKDHICKCVEGYHAAGGECRLDTTAVGGPCVEDIDCMYSNSQCVRDVCGCTEGFFVQNNKEGSPFCARGVGSPCSETEVCLAHKAVCQNDTCSCYSAFVPQLVSSGDYSACLKVAEHYHDACLESVQCQTAYGNNSECLDRICECHENFHFRDQFCWPIRELGEKCDRTSECYLEADSDRSECRNGFCQCLYEYEPQNTGLCISGSNSLNSVIVTLFSAVWICILLK